MSSVAHDALAHLHALVTSLGSNAKLQRLHGRLKKVRTLFQAKETPLMRIGVLGKASRGKSTLLNVLLGKEILPFGTPPTTKNLSINN